MTRKLLGFLRTHRHQLFDDAFEAELESMYRETGAGTVPVPPAMLAMATLLQACHGMSDAESVEMTVVDLRWQQVLDCLGANRSGGGCTDARGVEHRERTRCARFELTDANHHVSDGPSA